MVGPIWLPYQNKKHWKCSQTGTVELFGNIGNGVRLLAPCTSAAPSRLLFRHLVRVHAERAHYVEKKNEVDVISVRRRGLLAIVSQSKTSMIQSKATHCTPAIVPIPVAAAKPFDLLLRALEDAGGSTIDPPSAYAVQKYPEAAKFIDISSKIHEDLPGINEVATTLGSALVLLTKHLTTACLFSGPNEQRGILDYLLTENNWRGMIRVLSHISTPSIISTFTSIKSQTSWLNEQPSSQCTIKTLTTELPAY